MKSNYQLIRDRITTGSIVLFHGKGFFSDMIRLFCSLFSGKKTKYSHIGLLVRKMDRIFIFESTTLNGKNGVQMNLFSQAVKTYKGKMVVRYLCTTLDGLMVIQLNNFIEKNLGKPYEQHILELLGAATPWHIFKGSNKSFFCSELVASVYKMWELMPNSPEAKEFSPQNFAMGEEVDRQLKFSANPACLSSEIEIV